MICKPQEVYFRPQVSRPARLLRIESKDAVARAAQRELL